MNTKLHTLIDIIKKRQRFIFVVIFFLVVVIGFVFSQNNNNKEEHFLVKRDTFVQEVSVSGRVVSALRVDLVFSGSGRISSVYVDVGDVVRQNTLLATLENGDVYADVLQKEATYDAAVAKLNALKEGSRSEEIAVFESEVISAQNTLSQAKQNLINQIREAYTDVDDAIYHRVDQFISNAKSSTPNLDFTISPSLELEIESGRAFLETIIKKWSSEISVLTKESDLSLFSQTALEYLEEVHSFLTKIAVAVNSLSPNDTLSQTKIDKYRADVSLARSSINSAVTSLTDAYTSIENAEDALTITEKKLLLEEADATQEALIEEEARVKATLADLEQARAQYRKTLIRAPFDGIITKMDAHVGGRASSNTSDISMISADTLQIESFIPEINAPLLSLGDSAIVTLDAYGSEIPFRADIFSIDPAETIRDGVSTYRIKLKFTENDERIKSGMTANIVITTEEKDDVIAIPQGVVKKDGDKYLVEVKTSEGSEFREVMTGSVSSLGTIEIISGLEEGETILLKNK